MNTLINFLISFFSGVLFLYLFEYLYFKYFKSVDNIIFTRDITTNEITYTSEYQELLSVRLGNNSGYFVTYGKPYYHILAYYWSVFDIKNWIESLTQQDYAVIIELITKDETGLFPNNPRVILTREFMVNKYSNPIIISTLISTQIENIYEMFNIENDVDHYILIHHRLLTASQ